MDIKKFIEDRPYLYHLTSSQNAEYIIAERKLFSANHLIALSGDKNNQKIRREKRITHLPIVIGSRTILLRDQRPISLKALSKCLSDNWTTGDFLNHLNNRVFMWPTPDRLWRHYKRYALEKPIIFRFQTEQIIELNKHVKFCRLNSGATRPNSYLGGIAPERGPNSFLPATKFDLPVRDVAEVTFEKFCILPLEFYSSTSPDGIFSAV